MAELFYIKKIRLFKRIFNSSTIFPEPKPSPVSYFANNQVYMALNDALVLPNIPGGIYKFPGFLPIPLQSKCRKGPEQ